MPIDNKEYMRKYRQENRERITSMQKAWVKEKMKDLEYRTARAESQRKRRASSVATEEQRIKDRLRSAAWKKANPGKVAANTTARKKHVKIRTPKWLDAVDKFEMECIYTYCASLRKVGLKYEVDHVIPLLGDSVSGLHVPSNLLVVHEDENRVKSNKFEVM